MNELKNWLKATGCVVASIAVLGSFAGALWLVIYSDVWDTIILIVLFVIAFAFLVWFAKVTLFD